MIGLFATGSGLGRAAWLTALGLQQAGFRVELLEWDQLTGALNPYKTLPAPASKEGPGLLVVQANPPDSTAVLKAFREKDRRRYRRVGFWVWETERVPWAWVPRALAFDELWTPSRFSARALRSCHRRVSVVPHPCALDLAPLAQERPSARAQLGLPTTAFVVAFAFDMRSCFERKNPLGLMEAFREAFGDDDDARLLLRVGGRFHAPELWTALEEASRRTRSVMLVDSDVKIDSLYAACDVYASLHRAEGFGLTLAEAMLHGRAALASDWSGNLEFMSPDTSALTPCAVRAIRDPQGIYPARHSWAEPDLHAAAAALKILASDSQLRADLAERGRRRVVERLSSLPDFLLDAEAGRERASDC